MALRPRNIGVLGAGTMGAGIAQLAAQAGATTFLHDPAPEALERGVAGLASRLRRLAEKGRLGADEAEAAIARVRPAPDLGALADCELVVEAAPERLALKLELFAALTEVVSEQAVIATNTSSLSVTEIAAGVHRPERVVGLHFFNPAPVMRLVEVVAGAASSDHALAVARATGEAMGKHVIAAADVAGFLVNRVNRPFSLEALRLLEERVADAATIDRVLRLGGGFRMGPFELMDLIGIETNHAVAETMHAAAYGEPRYRPSPLAARMVAAGTLGRKTGRGWYAYPDDGPYRVEDPAPPAEGGGEGRTLRVEGSGATADGLAAAAAAAGWVVERGPGSGSPWLIVDCAARGAARGARDAPVARLVGDGSLHRLEPTAAGFHVLAPLDASRLVEVTRTRQTCPVAFDRLAELTASLGRHRAEVGDAPGLVGGRVVSQLVNEAAFLIGEGNGTAADVDAGLTLGVNHPRGPVAWCAALGVPTVVATLDALHAELGEPRYRVAPLLRRCAATGTPLA